MTIEEYFGDWLKVLDKKTLINIVSKLSIEYKRATICPRQANVFKAFELCSLKDLKIVMVGQDPYPQKGIATGILFGNSSDTLENKLSPSLEVIKESVIDFGIPHNLINFDPTLESWAKQGILMLNSALTVELNKIGSHVMLWRPFIAKLLENLSKYNTGIVYVLFGRQAQTFTPYINRKYNHVIEIEHPAYFARNNKKMPHKLFTDINNIVKGIYGASIEWYKEY